MTSMQTYLRRGQRLLRILYLDGRLHRVARVMGFFLGGFLFSAAALGGYPQPIAMAFVWACSGWSALPAALGSALGYLHFWKEPGTQCIIWTALALAGRWLTLDVGQERLAKLLLPATASLVVAGSGLCFQILMHDTTPVGVYLLRVVLAGGACWLFRQVAQRRNPILEWISWGLGVLALTQIMPIPYLGLGFMAVGLIAVSQSFPAAAIAGLAVDLAQVTKVPMAAVAVFSYLVRFLPRCPKWLLRLTPGLIYIGMMTLRGEFDLMPLPGLFLGGIIGGFVPGPAKISHRRGETGLAQVHLEIAAEVLGQTRQLLLQVPQVPVDEDGLIQRAAQRACATCPARSSCKDSRKLQQLPGVLLHKPLLYPEELPVMCRKSGRVLAELHRTQEQLCSIRADRERQQEYRRALEQQYGFLSDFLRDLSDRLSRRAQTVYPVYEPQILVCGNRSQGDSGDRCLSFAGTLCRYYVLLCDGMGTGPGAVREGKTAAKMLQKMLTAGFPAKYALQSVNSLCALRERAGAVTVDLAEIELYTGRVTLYKWGAAPSYAVSPGGVEKIGTPTPPPGLCVDGQQEQVHTLSLRRNQTLVLVSDGVPEDAAEQCCLNHADRSPGELARSLLTCSQLQGQDDATVVTIRLGLARDTDET